MTDRQSREQQIEQRARVQDQQPRPGTFPILNTHFEPLEQRVAELEATAQANQLAIRKLWAAIADLTTDKSADKPITAGE